ncbi:MAG: glycoside hydrolase family 2 protein [Candidatus Heimdallarchaeaceae archaeon]
MLGNKEKPWHPVKGQIMTKWAKEIDPEIPLPEYPRPQYVRENWLNLNGLWDYAIRKKKVKKISKFDGKILVPFALESALSGVKKKLKRNKRLWYRRYFTVPEKWEGKDLLLHFGAVDWETEVWVNGNLIGFHTGGYNPFSFEISRFLNEGQPNELQLVVYDPTNWGMHERGKQTLTPNTAFYTAVSGIWQTVWLEPVYKTRFDSLRMVPDIDKETLNISFSGVNILNNDMISISVRSKNKEIVFYEGKYQETIELKIPRQKLWSLDSPHLYDITFTLKRGKIEFDNVKSYFGMRKISLIKDKKGILRLALNNDILFQFGTLDQGYWPDGLYTAPTDEALLYDIQFTKDLGFNMIRKHLKVEPARWYYHCDKLGMLTWQDIPSGGSIIAGVVGMILGKINIKIGRLLKSNRTCFYNELEEMIENLMNHPSVVVWIPFNEAWGQFQTKEVTDFIRSLDNSRLINSASGWVDKQVGDMKDIHVYPGPDIPKLEENRVAVLGEFGGLGFKVQDHLWKTKIYWSYKKYKTKKELITNYTSLIKKTKTLVKQGLAAAVYTQTTDVEGEINGFITYDRKKIKMPMKKIATLNQSLYKIPSVKKRSK